MNDRNLPVYSAGEETMNTITHGIGIPFGIVCLILCIGKRPGAGSLIYGLSLIAVYTISAIYHGWKPGYAKKVLQVLDHCTIYTLIAGTYTPILLADFVPEAPLVGWGMLLFQWGCTLLCILLNAIDLRRFRVISMIAYILMGWAIIFVFPVAVLVMARPGLAYVFWGGVSYSVGAILYGIGSKRPWFHSIFHIFVLLGSLLQFLGVYRYII